MKYIHCSLINKFNTDGDENYFLDKSLLIC